MTRISVLGAGAWGTALAQSYALSGHDVTLWVRESALAAQINAIYENTTYLPNVPLSKTITITDDLAKAAEADVILNVIPAQYLRANLEQLAPLLRPQQPVVICAKGIEVSSHRLLSDIFHDICPDAMCAILTGPNFAADIARGKPSAATLAAPASIGKQLQDQLTSKNLRLYLTDDLVGAQVAGAIKNVIAIACGICHGLDLGESARAALVTRGLAEIARLTIAMGGRRETLTGQCGIGDMMLTCSSLQSRNFSFGVELARDKTVDEILKSRTSVTEGVATAKAALTLARARHIDMPIVESVYACLYEGLSVQLAVTNILNRPARNEGD